MSAKTVVLTRHDPKRGRGHAGSMAASCGHLARTAGIQYRCDLIAEHPGPHHVCGTPVNKEDNSWQVEWYLDFILSSGL